MKSRQIFPHEMRGLNAVDKSSVFEHLSFKWNVDLTYIKLNPATQDLNQRGL